MYHREWKCTCPKETEKSFIQYLDETGVKDTQAIESCVGYQVLRRNLKDGIEITFISFWETLESMKEYAGANLYKAVLYPDDDKYCIKSDPEVKVYEVLKAF